MSKPLKSSKEFQGQGPAQVKGQQTMRANIHIKSRTPIKTGPKEDGWFNSSPIHKTLSEPMSLIPLRRFQPNQLLKLGTSAKLSSPNLFVRYLNHNLPRINLC